MVETPRNQYERNTYLQVLAIAHRPNKERCRCTRLDAIGAIAKGREGSQEHQVGRQAMIGKEFADAQVGSTKIDGSYKDKERGITQSFTTPPYLQIIEY